MTDFLNLMSNNLIFILPLLVAVFEFFALIYYMINKKNDEAIDGTSAEEKIIKALRYCEGHTDKMWAASIIGILTGTDFREADKTVNLILKGIE